MNLKKKIATLAVLGTVGVGAMASAANIGVINMSQVYNAYPGYGAINMQVEKVNAEYQPQLQKIAQKIQGLKDDAAKQAEYDKSYVPVAKKANAAIEKIVAPMEKDIQAKIDTVRAQKNLPLIVADPRMVVSTEPDSQGVDVTQDVVALLKK
ncbi:OmpH family outer membrane protein [Veillonella magna]|uniref:OmpH family outer membrane protein n=1 Tax=Veillonella magna TaxID=464322 RepID=A0ABS2GFT2_9FIRM|nr:OmpH family outer membrane protein [Veillonella magna]MBD8975302.1 OmpH family outer membrane protein [Veillonella magna]MBM6824403.1 OmpH family outer membrane protein [Veillonella magna]MBM6912697.1 OmpH family outer membrane protein [Veillonella magna]